MSAKEGEYTYCLEVNGVKTDDINCSNASFHITKLMEDDPSVKSPVVNGNEVTFYYFAPTADSVSLAGQMNDWNPSADAMTYNEKTGFWSITKELEDAKYEYKFVINGGTWVTDPRNDLQSSGNSLVLISNLAGNFCYGCLRLTKQSSGDEGKRDPIELPDL